MRRIIAPLAGALVCVVVCSCWAGDHRKSDDPKPKPRSEKAYITQLLQSKDEASIKKGLDLANMFVDAGVQVDPQWVEALLALQRNAEAENLAFRGILNAPDLTTQVTQLQKLRVDALSRDGKYEQALVEAKSLYNVAYLQQTQASIEKLAACLTQAPGRGDVAADQFKSQQVAGVRSTTRPSYSADKLGQNVLETITVPMQPYEKAVLAKLASEDFVSLIGRGNLLLLADRPKEALKYFESAQSIAKGPSQTSTAIEAIAREIRAESGAVGPANDYVKSQGDAFRPLKATATE